MMSNKTPHQIQSFLNEKLNLAPCLTSVGLFTLFWTPYPSLLSCSSVWRYAVLSWDNWFL